MIWSDVMWCDLVWCGVMSCDMIWYDIWYHVIWYDMMTWYMIWHGMIYDGYDMMWYHMWYDRIWYDTWYGLVQYFIRYDTLQRQALNKRCLMSASATKNININRKDRYHQDQILKTNFYLSSLLSEVVSSLHASLQFISSLLWMILPDFCMYNNLLWMRYLECQCCHWQNTY